MVHSPSIFFTQVAASEVRPPCVRKHGVGFAHAEQVLRDPNALTLEDPDAEGAASSLLGWTRSGELSSQSTRHVAIAVASFPLARRANQRLPNMRKEYDFSRGKRGAVISSPGKTRITIMIDGLRTVARTRVILGIGRGNQTLINEALRATLAENDRPLTAKVMREIVR